MADQSQTPEATPRPWHMVSVSDNNDRWTIAQMGVGNAFDPGMFVGSRVRNEADAALIVEAVNSHDRLRRIEAAAKVLRVETFGRAHNDEDIEAAWDALKDALDGAALEEKP